MDRTEMIEGMATTSDGPNSTWFLSLELYELSIMPVITQTYGSFYSEEFLMLNEMPLLTREPVQKNLIRE